MPLVKSKICFLIQNVLHKLIVKNIHEELNNIFFFLYFMKNVVSGAKTSQPLVSSHNESWTVILQLLHCHLFLDCIHAYIRPCEICDRDGLLTNVFRHCAVVITLRHVNLTTSNKTACLPFNISWYNVSWSFRLHRLFSSEKVHLREVGSKCKYFMWSQEQRK